MSDRPGIEEAEDRLVAAIATAVEAIDKALDAKAAAAEQGGAQ